MTATLKSKQTSIPTVRYHLLPVASLLTPLIFHYPLPLMETCWNNLKIILLGHLIISRQANQVLWRSYAVMQFARQNRKLKRNCQGIAQIPQEKLNRVIDIMAGLMDCRDCSATTTWASSTPISWTSPPSPRPSPPISWSSLSTSSSGNSIRLRR